MRPPALDPQAHGSPDHELRELALAGLGRPPAPHHLSAADHGDPVGDLEDLVELVADEDDAGAVFAESAQNREDLVGLLGREHRGRLVEHEDARLAVDRFQDLDPLLLPDAQLTDPRERLDVESQTRGELADAPRGLAEVEQLAGSHDLLSQNDVLGDGQHRHEHEVLMHHADAAPDRFGRIVDGDRLAVDTDLAGVRCDEAVKDVHERRLPGAVLTEERVDLAPSYGERDVFVRQRPGGVALRDAAHLKDRRRVAHRVLK